MGNTSSFFLNREVFGPKMYRLWVYVFCSVVVRASPDALSSLENILKTEDLSPSNITFYNGAGETFRSLTKNLFHLNYTRKLLVHTPEEVARIVNLTSDEPVCYKGLGCFPMGSPWKSLLRPIGAPLSPEEIKASLYFFCRENAPSSPLDLYPEVNLEGISFRPNRTTVFIVHGFTSAGTAEWVKNLATAYLKVKDANIFCVDWKEGAQSMNYLQVAANTRVVGKQLGLFINKLIREYKASPEDFHLIGHSLGAHTCSYAAKEIAGLGHLTALDPAQPGFEGFDKAVRLDSSDAEFVEVFHTDPRPFLPALGFGMMSNHGDVDFYFNGFFQPGCLTPKVHFEVSLVSLAKIPVETLSRLISCAHLRAYQYYTESLDTSKCIFWGRKLKLWSSLAVMANASSKGLVFLPDLTKCTESTCIPLGLSARKSRLRGIFLVATNTAPPYCKG